MDASGTPHNLVNGPLLPTEQENGQTSQLISNVL
jgi:hypothetical protein